MTSHITRPKLWFKVLTSSGQTIDESKETWSLPIRQKNGAWLNFEDQPAVQMCDNEWIIKEGVFGTWLVEDPRSFYTVFPNSKVYVAEWTGPAWRWAQGQIWVPFARLTREATNLDLRPFGIHRAFRQIL